MKVKPQLYHRAKSPIPTRWRDVGDGRRQSLPSWQDNLDHMIQQARAVLRSLGLPDDFAALMDVPASKRGELGELAREVWREAASLQENSKADPWQMQRALNLGCAWEQMRAVRDFGREVHHEAARLDGKANKNLTLETSRTVWRQYVADVRSAHPHWFQNDVHVEARKRMIRTGVEPLPTVVQLKKHCKSPKRRTRKK